MLTKADKERKEICLGLIVTVRARAHNLRKNNERMFERTLEKPQISDVFMHDLSRTGDDRF